MKQLLIIRLPSKVPPDQIEPMTDRLEKRLNATYDVVITIEGGIERIEFDIVYNPHFKIEQDCMLSSDGLAAMAMQDERKRQFTQTDTSTNAYMEGKP